MKSLVECIQANLNEVANPDPVKIERRLKKAEKDDKYGWDVIGRDEYQIEFVGKTGLMKIRKGYDFDNKKCYTLFVRIGDKELANPEGINGLVKVGKNYWGECFFKTSKEAKQHAYELVRNYIQTL